MTSAGARMRKVAQGERERETRDHRGEAVGNEGSVIILFTVFIPREYKSAGVISCRNIRAAASRIRVNVTGML